MADSKGLGSNTHISGENLDARINAILKRVPDKTEFVNELEYLVDEAYPDDVIKTHDRGVLWTTIITCLVALAFLSYYAYGIYSTYKQNQPVSLSKLIKLHEKEALTYDILHRHLAAKGPGEAVKPILALANGGNKHAQNTICWIYLYGVWEPKNPSYGAKYCHMSADQNYPGAQRNLGVYYSKFPSVRDYEKSSHFYKLAADQGREDAAFALSNIYQHGPQALRDLDAAIKYRTLAADLGYPNAQLRLGEDYADGEAGLTPDYDKALKYLRLAKKSGHIDANVNLAYLYRDAEPPFRDYAKMIKFAKAASSQNHPTAFGFLGDAYAQGQGVDKDVTLAIKYYEIGSKLGNTYATQALAYLTSPEHPDAVDYKPEIAYRRGYIPYAVKNSIHYPENFYAVSDVIYSDTTDSLTRTLIFEYYAEAMLKGVNVPLDHITQVYFNKGYKEEYAPIINALEQFSSWGSGRHTYELALIYMSGSGVERDPQKSVQLISKAMDLRIPDSRDYIGHYYSGPDDPTERETEFARETLRKAAILGSEQAAKTLGTFYRDGIGVEVNNVIAMYWFEHADNGRLDQGDILKSLRVAMNPSELKKASNLIETCSKADSQTCLNTL